MQDEPGLLHCVFPAHAGMSPAALSSAPYIESFPRSRGDEPQLGKKPKPLSPFSPLTRG